MRARTAIALALLAVLLAGCGAGATQAAQHTDGHAAVPADMHRMPDGTLMSDSDMARMDMGATTVAAHPSGSAAMICSAETHESLQHNLGLAAAPTSTSTWAGGIYTCTYHLSGGDLAVSVQDATDKATGQHYFDTVRSHLPGLEPIRGLKNFGLPGYADTAGTVVFLKDGKTLDVDATGLPAHVGRYDQTPAHVAYGLAASILACWSEH
jgi:hypothetical protein